MKEQNMMTLIEVEDEKKEFLGLNDGEEVTVAGNEKKDHSVDYNYSE